MALGSSDCVGTINMRTCSGDIKVLAGEKTLLGVKPENLISDRCGLKWTT